MEFCDRELWHLKLALADAREKSKDLQGVPPN